MVILSENPYLNSVVFSTILNEIDLLQTFHNHMLRNRNNLEQIVVVLVPEVPLVGNYPTVSMNPTGSKMTFRSLAENYC